MAFNFYGTFTTGQLNAFIAFVNIQKVDLTARKAWLQDRRTRIGKFSVVNDVSGNPAGFSVTPLSSYGAKLFQAYKILGGIPEQDFLLTDRKNPNFLTRGQPIRNVEGEFISGGYSDEYRDGRIYRGDMRFDNILGDRVEKLKDGFRSVIKKKRENIEYKVKAALDYSEQLEDEVILIDKLLSDARNSIQNLVTTLKQASVDQNLFMPPKADGDLFGKGIGRVADNAQSRETAQRREHFRGSALEGNKNV